MDLPRPPQSRRGSLALSHSFSLEIPPPSPADLEQIHATSAQSPGLTSFGLGSPPAAAAEPLSLNRLYSRVKSVASAVRGAVGGGSPTRSTATVGSDRYVQNSHSRDSFGTTASEEGSLSNPLSAGPARARDRPSTQARPGSHNSARSSIDFVPPFLRRASTLAGRTNPSIVPVTVFRDGLEDGASRPGSFVVSRNSSTSNLQNVVAASEKRKTARALSVLSSRPSKTSVVGFFGGGGPGAGAAAGADEIPETSSITAPETVASSDTGARGDGSLLIDEDDEDYDASATEEEAFSDSSDDDVVLLNTKLPGAGTIRMRPSANNGSSAEKVSKQTSQSDSRLQASGSSTVRGLRQLPAEATARPPVTPNDPSLLHANVDTANSSSSYALLPERKTPLPSPEIISVPIGTESHPCPKSGVDNPAAFLPPPMHPHANTTTGTLKLPSTGPPQASLAEQSTAAKQRPRILSRISTDQSLLLPGFKITREPSSGTDSSMAGTTTAGSEQRDGTFSSTLRSGVDDTANGVYAVGTASGSSEAVSQALRQLRLSTLSREFWMKDEVCKDCFLCGSSFSAWRRKHHCRLCGQIFCSKCMTLIPGDKFGHQGNMRVCNSCLDIVNSYQDESESDELSVSSSVYQRKQAEEPSTPTRSPANFNMPRDFRPGKTPLMALPVTRDRRSQILEINAPDLPSPPRPTSSRSLKDISGPSRPRTAGSTKALLGQHSHPYSRHQHSRSVQKLGEFSNADERAPFHRNFGYERNAQKALPAFHADSILDPDLAPYMSDDYASDDEQMSVFASMAPKLADNSDMTTAGPSTPISNPKSDKGVVLNSAARRRAKSRSGGSMHAILGTDGFGNKSVHPSRSSRRRNPSLLGNIQQRPVTRGKSRGIMRSLTESVGGQLGIGGSSTPAVASPRASRSASMRGPLAPSVELNTASLEHVRKLLKQLLQDSEVQNAEKWEKALMPILLKSTDDLNPDIRAGDDIDIRHYVKVKRIPGGKPGDTSYISGVVFTKNLALKSMSRIVTQPRIVVVTFPIEYQRYQQQLMSLEPVIAQEREYLQNMVNRIVRLGPTLLLIEKNISGLALQLLAQANVATAYLVKPSVIEAVARCAQADIVSSVDKLAMPNFRLGRCQRFDVKTFVHDDIPGRKKTFMYLSGCQKELGCTIVLRGADMATLAVIKQITELMVYVVYNLKLETCLMRDEFALIPSSASTSAPFLRDPPVEVAETSVPADTEAPKPDAGDQQENGTGENESKTDNQESSADDKANKDGEVTENEKQSASTSLGTGPLVDDRLPDDIPNPTYYEDMVRKHETKILSASPFVKYMQPYLLQRARGLEKRLTYLRRLRDGIVHLEDEEEEAAENEEPQNQPEDPEKLAAALEEKPKETKPKETFQLVKPEMLHNDIKGGTKKMVEALRAIYDSEYDKALHVYETQKKQWENYLSQYDDLFDPFAHQSIAVLYSMVCTATTVPCEGPEIRRLEFYYQNMDLPLERSDASLGQYIEYLCDTADHTCTSVSCDKRMLEHHRSYVHGQARISVLISDKIACPIQNMQNAILMWSYCKICPNANTPAIPMSESTWKYSFGKYLELTFWSTEMRLKAGSCPHDLNRDHVRCFSYHGLAVVFQHDPIELLEIVVPRTKITYKPEIDLRIKNEQYLQHEDKINRFFASVKARLKSINVDSVAPDKVEACKAEIETHLSTAEEEREWLVLKLQEKYNKSKYYEIIPLNRALRALQEKVVEWDGIFTAFDNNYFPSEKDIRRLASLQLKKLFLDNTTTPAVFSTDSDPTPTQEKLEGTLPASVDGASTPGDHSPTEISSKHAHDVLASIVQEDQGQTNKDLTSSITSPEKSEHSKDGSPMGTAPATPTGQPVGLGDLTDDDATPKQELPMEKSMPGAADVFPATPPAADTHLPREATSSPSTSAELESSDDRAEGDKPLLDSSKKQQSTQSLRAKPSMSQVSSIPRLDARRKGNIPPAFTRTTSVQDVSRRKDLAAKSAAQPPTLKKPSDAFRGRTTEKLKGDKILSDRFRLSTLSKKPKERDSHIPRSVPTLQRRETKVSSLAKHFEQLSKEFERERAREKRQLAAKKSRALPVASSRPIVEVYRNVREAVEEASDEEPPIEQTVNMPSREASGITESSESTVATPSEPSIPVADDKPLAEEHAGLPSHTQSDVDASDGEISLTSDHESIPLPSISDVLPPNNESSTIDLTEAELPKHKSTWMKMLSNFWAERSASGWTSLDYPLHPTDHVFNDSDIIVREDEPSSLIAFALNCQDYREKLDDIRHSDYSHIRGSRPTSSDETLHKQSFNVDDHPELERSLLKTTGTHLKYQFQEGSARMFCKIFYAEQFDALRRNCGVADRYVESLSRCIKWDSKGGKSRSVFLKTQDERIVLKQLSPIETSAFIKFAPAYFQFMSEAFFHELPTVIAKMLGFYQIFIKNPTTGTEIKWDILVMENLFYDRTTTRVFDLKGSMRGRYMQSTGKQDEVLLDENMVEFIYESPLFVREHSKKLLRASLWNDTLFLSRQNVMDYSLMIGMDAEKKELCVGIIDCIRTFTWDKKLENWVKEKGFAGGGKNQTPTVVSPREYKHRFREAMERYVLEAPSCWHLFRMNYMGAVPLQLGHTNKEPFVSPENHTQEQPQPQLLVAEADRN